MRIPLPLGETSYRLLRYFTLSSIFFDVADHVEENDRTDLIFHAYLRALKINANRYNLLCIVI